MTIDVGRAVGNRPGYETMMSDHFRAAAYRHELPSFNIYGSPAMDWFPIGNEATAWSRRDDVLSLDELRERIRRIAVFQLQTELEGAGVLTLDDTVEDEFGDPVARVAMRLTDRDLHAEIKFAELMPQLGAAMGAVSIGETGTSGAGLGYHPAGATAMGRSPADGVCDTNLKVFGLDNLYLVSSSVFPHMGACNPSLKIVALALRLAAHLGGPRA